MKKKLGFIGCGNMGKAIVTGILKSALVRPSDIIASSKTENTAKKLRETLGINTILDNKEVAKVSDILFICVKPFMYKEVIEEIREYVKEDVIIISIAAGITLEQIHQWFNKQIKIVKTMPNTPALVGAGISAICPDENITLTEVEEIKEIFNSFGTCEILDEKEFHGFIALCGSSPAYVFMFIEAMADSAVKMGIPRKKAYNMAAQAVLGSAKMVLETGIHPGELKDMVCSPAGTTIEAVLQMERSGLRAAVIEGMQSCYERSKNM